MALEDCGLDDVEEGDIALWACQVALPIVPSPIIDMEMVQVAISSIVLLLDGSLGVSCVCVAHLIQHVIVLRSLLMVARFEIRIHCVIGIHWVAARGDLVVVRLAVRRTHEPSV